MNKFLYGVLCSLLFSGLAHNNAMASNSYQLLDSPEQNALTARCINFKASGEAEMVFYTSRGGSCTTNVEYISRFHVLTTATPGGKGVHWRAKQPEGSEICGRVITYYPNNEEYGEKSEWVCGNGSKSAYAGSVPTPLGRVVLEIKMMSLSTDAKPSLVTFGSKIWTP